jgi:hypothetical protein
MARAPAVFALAVALAAADVLATRAASADEPAQALSDADAKERSRAAFRRGVGQLRAQDWHAARASFEQAYQLFPHPSILLNLGIARLRTNDPVLAEQDLVRFLSEDAGASPDELAGAREALAEARSKIGTVRVVVSPANARVSVDGKRVEVLKRAGAAEDAVAAEARAKPGKHAVLVEADGYAAERREVDVAAKGETEVKVTLVPGETKTPPPPPGADEGPDTRAIAGWSLVGVAGAALVAGGAFALSAKAKADDYNDPTSGSYQSADTRSSGTTYRTLADVGFGVAIVSGAVAVLLLATDIGASKGTGVAASRVRWRGPGGRPALLYW